MTADDLANCSTVGAHRAPLQLNALFQLFLGHHTRYGATNWGIAGNHRCLSQLSPRNMHGVVRSLFIQPERKTKALAVSSIPVIATGFDGDFHSRANSPRQILTISGAVLDEFQIPPGAVYENMVIDGMDVMSLHSGQQVRIGDAILEVTIPCEPCIQMDRVRPGLQDALRNSRGMFLKVVTHGSIRIGDRVDVL